MIRRPAAWTAAGVLLAVAVNVTVASPAAADDRSTVRFEYDCESDLGGRDVTLFANGTVRLREGPWGERELYLEELLPEELESTLRRLGDIQSGAERRSSSLPTSVAAGDWIERCEIRLALPDAEAWSHQFTDYEVPPLEIASLIQVADDLAERTRPLTARDRIPAGYRPQRGDVLRTAEGERFQVVGPTTDGRGVELRGLDTPLQIFVSLAELGEAFASLEDPESGTSLPDIGLPTAPDPVDP